MAKEPATLFYRILKIAFKVLLILSSGFIFLGLLTLSVGVIALRDDQSQHERSHDDLAALKIVITCLFISVSLGTLQTIIGWIGILKTRLRFITLYFFFEILCFVLWLMIYLFSESKSIASYSVFSSLLRLIVSQLIIQTIRRHLREEKERSAAEGLPVDDSLKNGTINTNSFFNRVAGNDDTEGPIHTIPPPPSISLPPTPPPLPAPPSLSRNNLSRFNITQPPAVDPNAEENVVDDQVDDDDDDDDDDVVDNNFTNEANIPFDGEQQEAGNNEEDQGDGREPVDQQSSTRDTE